MASEKNTYVGLPIDSVLLARIDAYVDSFNEKNPGLYASRAAVLRNVIAGALPVVPDTLVVPDTGVVKTETLLTRGAI